MTWTKESRIVIGRKPIWRRITPQGWFVITLALGYAALILYLFRHIYIQINHGWHL